jgi:hypothetical protein
MQASENSLPIWPGTHFDGPQGRQVVIGGDGQVSISQTSSRPTPKGPQIGKGDVIGGLPALPPTLSPC